MTYGNMRWTNVAFAHWRAEPRALADRVPEGLTLDVRDGSAWISLVALVVVGPAPKPLVGPGTEKLLGYRQINVRTYVTGQHGPGILLLETLVDSRIAAMGASLMGQPYHFASGLSIEAHAKTARVEAPGLSLDGAVTGRRARPGPKSVARWLVDRWWAYGRVPGTKYAMRVEHAPWLLRAWKPVGFHPALAPLVGNEPPVQAQVGNDVEVAIAEIAREGLPARVAPPVEV